MGKTTPQGVTATLRRSSSPQVPPTSAQGAASRPTGHSPRAGRSLPWVSVFSSEMRGGCPESMGAPRDWEQGRQREHSGGASAPTRGPTACPALRSRGRGAALGPRAARSGGRLPPGQLRARRCRRRAHLPRSSPGTVSPSWPARVGVRTRAEPGASGRRPDGHCRGHRRGPEPNFGVAPPARRPAPGPKPRPIPAARARALRRLPAWDCRAGPLSRLAPRPERVKTPRRHVKTRS